MSKEFDMKIDVLHALEDFLDAYDNHSEMVVTEAIANAIDVGATSISVSFGIDSDGNQYISFHNDGPPMNKKQFDDYHVIARSSKAKGSGIGFAGIGAKVYLAAWEKTVITTETIGGTASFASKMYVKNRKLKAVYCTPKQKKSGTHYKVLLKPRDFNYIKANLNDIIVDAFSPAMISGLNISVNKNKIAPWNPPKEFKFPFTVIVKGKEFPAKLIITYDDIPKNKCNIQYHVSGKVITTKQPSYIYDIKPLYQKRFHVYVDASAVSNQLNLTKTNFKSGSGGAVSPVFQEVERRVYNILEKKGYVKATKAPPSWESNKLTKFFEKLFKDPKYAFLNPQSRGGLGSGKGPGSGGSGGGGGSHTSSGTKSGSSSTGSKGGGSFAIGFVDRPGDKRDGWLDPATNKLMINISQPLFIKYETDIQSRNQRIGTILTSVLIKNAAQKKSMTPSDAFDLQSELLTLAKDEMW